MKIFAIELSSAVGSVAFLDGARAVLQRDIPLIHGRTSTLFSVLQAMQEEAAWGWDEIDLFAVGRGPGRYSGMRVALTAAQGLAAPGSKPVRAVSSGAALAHAVAADYPDHSSVAVMGDARRDRVWRGHFERRGERVSQKSGWELIAVDRWESGLPANTVIASPDLGRLRPLLPADAPESDPVWIDHECHPRAEWVGRLACAEHTAKSEPEPLTPIYLHPPVQRS